MKKILFIVVSMIFIILISSYIIERINYNKEPVETSARNVSKNQSETSINEPNDITIYDIEEGYLTVPYNSKAQKNNYEWNKLIKMDNGYYQYEDDLYETRLGIDVSSYQGEIDWSKVKNEGIEFAILRLGYRGYGKAGKIVLDDRFEQNYENATKEGIEIGVYFFSQAISEEEVIEEAGFVLANIEDKLINYPVFYDLEKIKNDTARTDNLTNEEVNRFTHQFCENIEKSGYIAGIYGNAKTFTTRMRLEEFSQYTKWYADYQEEPLYPYEFTFWQYTESGKVPGIDTKVDLNVKFIKK